MVGGREWGVGALGSLKSFDKQRNRNPIKVNSVYMFVFFLRESKTEDPVFGSVRNDSV